MAKKFKLCGKQRTLSFGLCAIQIYCEKMGGDIEQLDKIFQTEGLEQIKAVSTIVWAAAVASCELYGEELDFNIAGIKQDIGDMEQETFADIMEEFKKSRYMGKTIADYYYTPVEQEATDGKKKKPAKKP